MSQLSRGIFGAIAVSLTFGAALAAGRDLAEIQNPAGNSQVVNTSEAINRAAKADRADGAVSAAPTRTISLRQDVLTDTSVLIRLPVAQEARNNPPQLLLAFGHPNMTCTVRRNISALLVLGSDQQYQNGDSAENHNTCIRRPSCVGLRTACRTQPSTSCAHLWMMRSSLLCQSIVQNLAGCTEANAEHQTTSTCRQSSR